MTAPKLLMRGEAARRYVGVGETKWRQWVEAGIVPSWTDPETGTRWYSRPVLDEWARTLGGAA